MLGEGQYFATRDALATGDINGDGIHDILVGASYASPGGKIEMGRAYLVWDRGHFQPITPLIWRAMRTSPLLRKGQGIDWDHRFLQEI